MPAKVPGQLLLLYAQEAIMTIQAAAGSCVSPLVKQYTDGEGLTPEVSVVMAVLK